MKQVNLPHPYTPGYKPTANYMNGMGKIVEGEIPTAYQILLNEPNSSICYGLAQANAAMCARGLGIYDEAEKLARNAISEFGRNCPHPPTILQAYRVLGEVLAKQGKLMEALREFTNLQTRANSLIASDPAKIKDYELQFAHGLNSWASVYMDLGDYVQGCIIFSKARKLYKKYFPQNLIGLAELFTNYGLALGEIGKKQLAIKLLKEAQKYSNNNEQNTRLKLSMLDIDINAYSQKDAINIYNNAIQDAINENNFSIALLRYCKHATYLKRINKVKEANQVLSSAKLILPNVSPFEFNRPKYFYTLATTEDNNDDMLSDLLQAAELWYKILSNKIIPDIKAISKEMHDTFRLLTRILIEKGRIKEALIAFEIGRTLSYILDIEPDLLNILSKFNLFENSKISLELLEKIQANLSQNEIMLSIAIVPPDVICFAISKNDVELISNSLAEPGENIWDTEKYYINFSQELFDLGVLAIKPQLDILVEKIKNMVRDRAIIKVAPYAYLHNIPWRALLKRSGLDWKNINYSTVFSLLLFYLKNNSGSGTTTDCIGISYGKAGNQYYSIDFANETEYFGKNFTRFNHIRDSKINDLIQALKEKAIVFVSCHGFKNPGVSGIELILSDGNLLINNLFDKKIQSPIVILSSCESGFYSVDWGDNPRGAAPQLIRLGALYCIGARYKIDAKYSQDFFASLGKLLSMNNNITIAFHEALKSLDSKYDLIDFQSCLELISLA